MWIEDDLAKLEALFEQREKQTPMSPENLAAWTIFMTQAWGAMSGTMKKLED